MASRKKNQRYISKARRDREYMLASWRYSATKQDAAFNELLINERNLTFRRFRFHEE